MGFLRAAPAVGAAIIALGLAWRPIERNVGVKMLWAVAAFGAGTVAFGLSTNFLLSLALLVVMGAADMFSVFVRGTLIQLNTPDHMRGRVSAASGLAISASNELGEMRAGAMGGGAWPGECGGRRRRRGDRCYCAVGQNIPRTEARPDFRGAVRPGE